MDERMEAPKRGRDKREENGFLRCNIKEKKTMEFVQAFELGREPVKSVNAGILATVLRELVTRYEQTRRSKLHHSNCQVACRENLEIRRRKFRKLDDEGFESDEDARSSTSSCCLVDDHVFKRKEIDRSSPSNSQHTDSANSSGSSDTDDQEIPEPKNTHKESYPIENVIFCHTESRYPNTIAWVVKTNSSLFDTTARLGTTGVINISDNCLEVIVIRCKQNEDFRKLCDNYRELSRRVKLDHYKSIGRKKPIVLSTLTDTTNVKVSLADMKVGRSSLLKASELSILNPKIMSSFKTEMKNSVSLTNLMKQEAKIAGKEENLKKANSLSNISRFNLLQRTDTDGMTHLEVSKSKSKIQKEIEGVILTEIDLKKEPIRQRKWEEDSKPPVRPERKKYLRKKLTENTNPQEKSKSKFYLPIEEPKRLIERTSRKTEDVVDHRRSRSVGRKPPMAYRYIDITSKLPAATVLVPNLGLKVGLPGERRRRNSFDDLMGNKTSLKSVIKKNSSKKNSNKFCEPKKVTFSAFAQVQVVD